RIRPARWGRARRARRPRSAREFRFVPSFLFVVRLGEQLSQARQPRKHPALDRTERFAEPIGELGLCEAAVVGELDRLALLVWEPPQGLLDARTLKAQPGLVLRQVPAGLRRGFQRFGPAGLLAPDDVHGASMNEREDPSARLRAFGNEATGRAP